MASYYGAPAKCLTATLRLIAMSVKPYVYVSALHNMCILYGSTDFVTYTYVHAYIYTHRRMHTQKTHYVYES